MRIEFECHGGFASYDLSYKADTDDLTPTSVQELTDLVAESGFFDVSQGFFRMPDMSGADAVSFRLKLQDESKKKTLSYTDMNMPEPLRPLFALVQQMALEAQRRDG